MKKTAVLMMVLMLTVLASAAPAGDNLESMAGRLFLFQKCLSEEAIQALPEEEQANYGDDGCPVTEGPWPMLPGTGRWGQMKYNLLGTEFQFSFQGKNVDPEKGYTLIYYPDPWPGKGLMCLGAGKANPGGNLQIHGKMEIPGGLPQPYDANYKPVAPSGAVGAKIWLVLSEDVQCEATDTGDVDGEGNPILDPPQMLGWNPASYLFEGNLIVYQHVAPVVVEEEEEETVQEAVAESTQAPQGTDSAAPAPQGNSENKGQGLAKGKNK